MPEVDRIRNKIKHYLKYNQEKREKLGADIGKREEGGGLS
jgi:hypothetical protein